MIFLVIYDASQAKLVEVKEYEASARAKAMSDLARTQERFIRELDHVEVGLFEAASRAVFERTHSRYFKSLAQLSLSLTNAASENRLTPRLSEAD